MASDRVITPRRRVAALSVVLAGLAACGGSSTTDPTTTLPASSSSAATTTSASPTTTTVPAATTVPPAATTTTLATTTTVDTAGVESQIRADFERTWLAYLECVYEPESCAFSDVNIPGSPIDRTLHEAVATLVGSNLRGSRDSGPLSYVIESVSLAPRKSTVIACMTDGGVIYDIGNPDDVADDVVVNDLLTSTRSVWTFRRLGDRWLRYEVDELAIYPDVLTCGA